MQKKTILALTLSLLSLSVVIAQGPLHCGTMDILFKQMKTDTALFNAYQESLHTIPATNSDQSDRSSSLIYIPVVFHVINNGQAVGVDENISDAQILSEIDELNLDYAGQNDNFNNIPGGFKAVAAQTNIRFCMAKYDPNGSPTNGIVRHNLGTAGWDQSDMENTIKQTTVWDHKKYLNVWTINVKVGGYMDISGILAYAQFPFTNSPSTDGVVARYNVIGTKGVLLNGYQHGRTLTHEIGHYLNLRHTWGDDGGLCINNGGKDDQVADTPDEGNETFGCPVFPYYDNCTKSGDGVMFMNYMDYTDDNCRSMFTNGQYARMTATLNNTGNSGRNILTTVVSKCFDNTDAGILSVENPHDTVCSDFINPIVNIHNIGVSDLHSLDITYSIDGSNPHTISWSGVVSLLDVVSIALPASVHLADGVHTLRAFVSNVNGGGADTNLSNDSITKTFRSISYGAGFSPPYSEDFETGNIPPQGGDLINPNKDITWAQGSVGGYGRSSFSTVMDNSNYTSDPGRRIDAFTIGDLDFTVQPHDSLTFDIAYSPSSTNNDSLSLSFSLDCGKHWTMIWVDGGSTLATSTASSTTKPFVPTATEWKTLGFDLSRFAGFQRVNFKFENIGHWGNAMYIDNINVHSFVATGVQSVSKTYSVSIYPNPAQGITAVKLPDDHPYTDIEVVNTLGQTVLTHHIIDPISLIDVKGLSEGLYLLRLHSATASQTERLLIGGK